MNRRAFLGALGLFAAPHAARAQQSTRPYRIGLLMGSSEAFVAPYIGIFRQALRALGHVEGANISIEYRYADGNYDRLPHLAADLIAQKVDIVVTEGTPPTRAALGATKTVPIVMTVTGDPVASGLVRNLARPGGNLTGASFFLPDLAAKRIQLLKELIPALARVTVVWNPGNAVHGPAVKSVEAAAKVVGIEVHHVTIQSSAEIDEALLALSKRRESTLVIEDATINISSTQIARAAVTHHFPTMFGLSTFVEAGGLMAYGPNRPEMWRRAATFVHKIRNGARPGELPVEQPVRFDLVLNLKTARELRLIIPPSLLLRADQLIE